jgi:hypothetical protein
MREFAATLIGGGIVSTLATAGLGWWARRDHRAHRSPQLPVDLDVTVEMRPVPRRRQLRMRTQLRRVVQHATSCAEAVRRAAVEAGRSQSGRW